MNSIQTEIAAVSRIAPRKQRKTHVLKYLVPTALLAVLITSCGNGTTTTTAPAPVVTPPPAPVVNLTGVYTETERTAAGTTSENRVEFIDNNGTLTGNIRQTKINNIDVSPAPVKLNGTRSLDGKKAQYSFVRGAKVLTHTLTFDDAGGITVASDDWNVVSTTFKRVQ